MPTFIRLRVVRADSGFCLPIGWIVERLGLRYIVWHDCFNRCTRCYAGLDLDTEPSAGPDVAEVWTRNQLARPRRVIRSDIGGGESAALRQKLVDCPAICISAGDQLAESVRPIAVWREYNGRPV